MKKTTLILIAISLIFASCEKISFKKSKTKILTETEWQQTAYTVSPPLIPTVEGDTQDIWAEIDDCNKYRYNFMEDSTVIFKYNCNDAKLAQTWYFAEDETEMFITPKNYKIEEFGKDKFVLSQEITVESQTYVFTSVFEPIE